MAEISSYFVWSFFGAGVYISDGRLDAKLSRWYSSYTIGPGSSLFAELLTFLRALQQLLFLAQSPGGISPIVYNFINNLAAINNSLGICNLLHTLK